VTAQSGISVLCERACRFAGDKQRFERSKPDARNAVRPACAGDSVEQRFSVEIPSVARQMDAREHDLLVAFARQRLNF